jgi:predicted MFS family arabinose efflux permease
MNQYRAVRAWIVFAAAYLASVAAAINQFKIPPALPMLIDTLHLGLPLAGSLMSVFAVIGIFLALPAGQILRWWGAGWTGAAAGLLLAAGGCLGAVAGGAGTLLASRVVEGLGMGLIAVVMPSIIAMGFPANRRGLPMGLWATWVPIGSVIMFNLAPALIEAFSWRMIWWGVAGLSAAAGLLCRLLLHDAEGGPGNAGVPLAPIGFREGLTALLTCGRLWRISLAFSCFTTITLSMYTFLPVFLTAVHGFSLSAAGFTVGLIMSTTLFSSPLTGWLSDRIGSRRPLFALPFLLLALMLTLPFEIDAGWIRAFMVFFGLVTGGIPMAAFALVPDVVPDARLVPLGMAILVMGQNLGMVVGPVLFGGLVETVGWTMAGYALIPVALLGFGAAWQTHAGRCVSAVS